MIFEYTPVIGDESKMPIDAQMLQDYDTALQLIEDTKLEEAAAFITQAKFKKQMREILLYQIHVIHKIRKHMINSDPEKVRKWTQCLISETLRTRLLTELNPSVVIAKQTLTPLTPSPTDELLPSPPTESFTPQTREELARGFLVLKLDKNIRRYTEPALAKLTQLIESHWMYGSQKKGKPRFGIGRTELLILAELLSVPQDATLTAIYMARAVGLKPKTVSKLIPELRSLLRNSWYALTGTAQEGLRLKLTNEKRD